MVDVPGRLTARTRKLSGHSARKTDEFDARSVAIVGANHTGLRRVQLDDTPAELRVLLDRRWHLVSARHRVICRFHDRITELTAGGAKKALSPTVAAKALRSIRTDNPADDARRQAAKDLLAEWRWLTRRINDAQRRVDQAVTMHGTTLTDIVGIGTTSAATIVAIVDDPTRFPTRGHFASYNGTAPVDASSGTHQRHRLNRRGNRQLNKVIHTVAVTQIRTGGPGRDYYDRKLAEGKNKLEAVRALKRQLSNVIYRRMMADVQRRQTVRDGHPGTSLMAA